MATTSSRALTLLSLLSTGRAWSGRELAGRLAVSSRTLRRDVDALRELGFPVTTSSGPTGGYRLAAGGTLPPLLFDDEQAVAVALALQTAPVTVAGVGDGAARALTTLRQVLPVHLRPQVDALRVTAIPNVWEFAAPPIDRATLAAVGDAVRRGHLLRFDLLGPDGHRPEPGSTDFSPPLRVEPHHLAVWAGRWYLVSYDLAAGGWVVHRVDRIHPLAPTGMSFERRPLPAVDVAEYVVNRHDRGDTVARWPCTGSVLMELPADLAARWAPAGAVVERVSARQCRFTVGAWSWAGVVGILATFGADVSEVEPDELRAEMAVVSARLVGHLS
ncbi:WYL domain-containing protein [Modestobacter sp. VKM Ac-2977]|uniref:helix-turn-helix transcriptional regulator n=1 Tax=Modestobacter sp. VKM Ac-2977 TaxID=3004131 RepID=UPI0022AB2A05|nr:WYL domain-containing protein [Modestobacter sp. VKM Ac-2977]MCZ2821343.1 WYL domain-containing protein [Modestobacter sp. VKM Ac-2977]